MFSGKREPERAGKPDLVSKEKMSLSSIVRRLYSLQESVSSYSTVGLWASEEILVDRYCTHGSTVLDAGCGGGRTSIPLARKGYIVTGIDFIHEMIKSAIESSNNNDISINHVVMDISNLGFKQKVFKNVFLFFNLIEFIPGKTNRQNVLKNVWQILEPGGVCIVTFRSGLALGKRTFVWLLILIEYIFFKIIKTGDWDFGDKLWKGQYYHYINPFKLNKVVKTIGFDIIYFNSNENIIKSRQSTFYTNFSSDITLFLVLRKAHGTGRLADI